MQDRKQEMPPAARDLPADGLPRRPFIALTAGPPGFRRTKNGVYRSTLVVIGGGVCEMQVQSMTTFRLERSHAC
jgi:hypothetical protein